MPPLPIDQAQVRHVARLARLELSAEEVHAMAGELGAILQYTEMLAELELATVAPTLHAQHSGSGLRADAVRAGLSQSEALAMAPAQRDGGFSVPRVLEEPR